MTKPLKSMEAAYEAQVSPVPTQRPDDEHAITAALSGIRKVVYAPRAQGHVTDGNETPIAQWPSPSALIPVEDLWTETTRALSAMPRSPVTSKPGTHETSHFAF